MVQQLLKRLRIIIRYIGWHNNPLSRLICECKSNAVDLLELEEALMHILNTVKEINDVQVTLVFANIDLWFQKPVQEALTLIKQNIDVIENQAVKKALLVAFSSTVRKMSEMEDSMILAARRSGNREMPKYDRIDVFDNFESNVRKIISAYEEWNPIIGNDRNSFMIDSNDARDVRKEEFFDAIVTHLHILMQWIIYGHVNLNFIG